MNQFEALLLQQQIDAILKRAKSGKRADRRELVIAEIRQDADGNDWALIAVKLKDTDRDSDELPIWLRRE